MVDKYKSIVEFRALQLANEQRNAYGLRYNDFTRYRKHCANRTHRLRSSLNMTHGKGKDFKKLPPLNPDQAKDRHLQTLLFEAERAWAYAQELTNSSLSPNKHEIAGSLRHSATGRYRRAVHWSTQLLSLCQTLHSQSRMSTENLIEATIYTIILNGRFLRYRDDLEDALIQLSVARSLLDLLAEASLTSRDQALAILFSDEIGPEIRYCAHELGHAKAYDVNGIVAELAPKHRNEIVENCDELVAKLQQEERTVASPSNLKLRLWEGEPVPVRYPELVDVLLRLQQAEEGLDRSQKDHQQASAAGKKSKSSVTAYDAVLAALSDAEDVSRKLKETQQFSGLTGNSSSSGRDIHFVHTYIVYQLLSRRIQRDLLLMDTLLASGSDKSKLVIIRPSVSKTKTDPVDNRLYPAVVKLLDAVLQSLTQMRTLSIVDDNADLASATEARIAFINARRCVYLAHCYVAVKKYTEALALLQHATIHIRDTNSSFLLSESDLLNELTPLFFPLHHEDTKTLETFIAGDALEFKREWFAYNGGSTTADPSTYKKPLFFNIALNYVELDMDRLQQRAGKQPVPVRTPTKQKVDLVVEKKQIPKAKVEEIFKTSPEPQQQTARGGLSSLLGGWWSKS